MVNTEEKSSEVTVKKKIWGTKPKKQISSREKKIKLTSYFSIEYSMSENTSKIRKKV